MKNLNIIASLLYTKNIDKEYEIIIIIKQLITRHNVNSSIHNEILKTKEESQARDQSSDQTGNECL